MTRRPSSGARLALLGDVLKLLRQRRREIDSVLIHPDGTIEVRLNQRPEVDREKAELDDVLARFRKEHGYG